MNEEIKITLPKNIQKQMIEFFLKTSIPRKAKKGKDYLPENEEDK